MGSGSSRTALEGRDLEATRTQRTDQRDGRRGLADAAAGRRNDDARNFDRSDHWNLMRAPCSSAGSSIAAPVPALCENDLERRLTVITNPMRQRPILSFRREQLHFIRTDREADTRGFEVGALDGRARDVRARARRSGW